jgi:hypothetical protein
LNFYGDLTSIKQRGAMGLGDGTSCNGLVMNDGKDFFYGFLKLLADNGFYCFPSNRSGRVLSSCPSLT